MHPPLIHLHPTHINEAQLSQLPEILYARFINDRLRSLMFVITQSTIHLFCFTHSVHASIPQDEFVESLLYISYLLFHLFWALRARAERPLTSLRGFLIEPVYFYYFISDASEVADNMLWPETCFQSLPASFFLYPVIPTHLKPFSMDRVVCWNTKSSIQMRFVVQSFASLWLDWFSLNMKVYGNIWFRGLCNSLF